MAQYKNFETLKAGILAQMKTVLSSNLGAMLEDFLKWEISRSVEKNVYDKYEPKAYERRKNKGGLSDRRNIKITSIELDGQRVHITAENLTEGDWNSGQQISKIIEYGAIASTENVYWMFGANDTGGDAPWLKPRPFMGELMEEIKRNPKELHDIIAQSFKNAGFKIKNQGKEY